MLAMNKYPKQDFFYPQGVAVRLPFLSYLVEFYMLFSCQCNLLFYKSQLYIYYVNIKHVLNSWNKAY